MFLIPLSDSPSKTKTAIAVAVGRDGTESAGDVDVARLAVPTPATVHLVGAC